VRIRDICGFKKETVHDIGGSKLESCLLKELQNKLLWHEGPYQKDRLLPASVLHDDAGLQMWAEMNRQPNYYQTNDEIGLLNENSKDLAARIGVGCCLVDLGSG
jgi:uncharacterized SAM-dependent methyltransferase